MRSTLLMTANVTKSLDEERASERSEGLLALVVGVDYLVKLCRDGEREERTLPSKKESSQMDLLVYDDQVEASVPHR